VISITEEAAKEVHTHPEIPMKLPYIFLVLCVTVSPGQRPEIDPTESGNAFLRDCSVVEKVERTNAEETRAVGCVMYIRGALAGAAYEEGRMEGLYKHPVTSSHCFPEAGVEADQLVRIILKYVRDNPAKAHELTIGQVMSALCEAFPCPKPKR
jgi:hypothetical protein